MSWQLTSFLILGVALALGFAWYERPRPPARVLALVGALAALAVVGRIAFAPFPNVKPTTDIVLFAGYALGGAPGFAVGAVTALVSNIFFSHGPWTPWQMAAWGGVGMRRARGARAGARLASRTPRRRWGCGRAARARPLAPRVGLRPGRAGLRDRHGPLPVDARRRADGGELRGGLGAVAAVQRRAHRGERGVLPADRASAGAGAAEVSAALRGAVGCACPGDVRPHRRGRPRDDLARRRTPPPRRPPTASEPPGISRGRRTATGASAPTAGPPRPGRGPGRSRSASPLRGAIRGTSRTAGIR